MNLKEFIQSHGYAFEPTELDSKYHEFSDSLGNKGWYIGSELSTGKITFTFGDWRNPDRNFSFISDETLTQGEQDELDQKNKQFHADKNSRQEQAKRLAQEIFARWDRIGSTGESKYLASKSLPSRIPGTLVKPTEVGGHVLVIPLRDEHDELWNFQSIYDDASKQFFNFGRTQGLFFKFEGSEKVVVCEGFGTGAAIHSATGATVIVAFSLGNLRSIAEKFPGADIAGDYDGATEAKMRAAGHKDPHNPGVRGAMRIAKDLGRNLFLPVQDLTLEQSVDFADLWVSGGKDAVLKAFESPVQLESPGVNNNGLGAQSSSTSQGNSAPRHRVIGHWVNGLEPMSVRFGPRGGVILPEEMEVVERLYLYYKESMVQFDGEVFVWSGKHWRPFNPADETNLRLQIKVLHAGYGTHQRFQNVFKGFLDVIPKTTRNMYYTNPQRVTFNNGTLAIDYIEGDWRMNFREHRKEDFSTNLIPYDYDPEAKNTVFEETIGNILGDGEREAKVRAVKQMFGSALAPLYPRLFLLVGKPGSGKSTLITLATTLVSTGNVSSVQPADFNGFNMEPMAGMLVNAVTDLDVARPISDAVIKQIEDRIPIQINRKFKKAVLAPFPAVHIFGANDIPPTLDRGSMAHTRRWTFIPCEHFQRDSGEHDKERVTRIREAGMGGVINFAIEGLKDLLGNKGHFFVPDSGAKRMKQWQTENDPIASFLEAVGSEDLAHLVFDPDSHCPTTVLWKAFSAWHEDAYNARPKIPKMKFYRRLEIHLGPREIHQGNQVFGGVALRDLKSKGGKYSEGGKGDSGFKPNPPSDAGFQMYENSSEMY